MVMALMDSQTSQARLSFPSSSIDCFMEYINNRVAYTHLKKGKRVISMRWNFLSKWRDL
jgi:hypothetical protein